MSKCGFCETDIKEFDGKQAGYLVASTNENGDGEYHTHVHGTLDDKNIAEDLIDAQIKETGLTDLFKQKFSAKDKLAGIKEIIFHNRQRIGDMFMFTCGVRDFAKAYPDKKIGILSTCGHIWDNNPYVTKGMKEFYSDSIKKRLDEYNKSVPKLNKERKPDKPEFKVKSPLEFITPKDLLSGDTNVLKIGPQALTNASNRLDWHFANAFRYSIEEKLGITIPQGESRGDIWFTKEEYNAPRITEKPYWILVTGGEKGWGCKMYPDVRWQAFVDENPEILFYQLGATGDHHIKLKGDNVVDYIGKTENRDTGIRDLFKLFLNAEGSVGLVSFHMHLSGALKKPCVVIAGGREPVAFTRYAGHQYIANDGTMPCSVTACWHCDIKACTNPVTVDGQLMPKCVDMIPSTEVTRYLKRYYEGGRLKLDTPSEKPNGLNLVDTPVLEKKNPMSDNVSDNKYGMPFGGGSITERDWEFISGVIDKYKVDSVLEFGAGLSTLLLNDKVKNVVTYEDKQGWIDKINKIKPCDIRLWDGKILSAERHKDGYDMVFVDGPAGDIGREWSTKIASVLGRVVIVHDAGREWARVYQDKYLKEGFDGPIKGGHRCHLFVRKEAVKGPVITQVRNSKVGLKHIKFVSTARGWGGCARSVTTIMKMLLKAGHSVEFIPFRNTVSSKEFQDCIKNELEGLKVTTSYDTLSDPCDVLVVYADDFIWEFDAVDIVKAFSNLKAEKKVMILNYRRGKVGQSEWTKGWDKYMFLNSTQERELLRLLPDAKTKVLPPCTDLSAFFLAKPNFDNPFHKETAIRIVRHSSQGDTKFPKDFQTEVDRVLSSRPDVSIRMMPGPSFVPDSDRFKRVGRNSVSIPDFLATGNLFWYSLPKDYMDMGPRVIIEAMAAGLPVIADNWGGAVDRITPDCGWLCKSKEEMSYIIQTVTLDELRTKGEAARERAKGFRQECWLEEIL